MPRGKHRGAAPASHLPHVGRFGFRHRLFLLEIPKTFPTDRETTHHRHYHQRLDHLGQLPRDVGGAFHREAADLIGDQGSGDGCPEGSIEELLQHHTSPTWDASASATASSFSRFRRRFRPTEKRLTTATITNAWITWASCHETSVARSIAKPPI